MRDNDKERAIGVCERVSVRADVSVLDCLPFVYEFRVCINRVY